MRGRIVWLQIILNLLIIHGTLIANDSMHYVSPLFIPIRLAGTFGEARKNHFHAGYDFATNDTQGFPVKAVLKGYVCRIKIEPVGYGKAIYVNHPNGLTSVYGHLRNFSPKIEKFVTDFQYQKKSYSVDIILNPDSIRVKQGEVLAFSGNTGNTEGPHLHFEMRDANKQRPIRFPLSEFGVKDTIHPIIKKLWVFNFLTADCYSVNEDTSYSIKKYADTLDFTVMANKNFGLGIEAYDLMNGTGKPYDINHAYLLLDDTLYYSLNLDTFSYSETSFINDVIDFKTFNNSHKKIIRLFSSPNQSLSNIWQYKHGYHYSFDGNDHIDAKIIILDNAGNANSIRFRLKLNNKADVPDTACARCIEPYKKIAIDEKQFKLEIGTDAVFHKQCFSWRVDSSEKKNFASNILTVGNTDFPLKKSVVFEIKPNKIGNYEKQHLLLAELNGKGKPLSVIKGEWINGYYKANIKEWGKYALTIDTIKPVVIPGNFAKDMTNRNFLSIIIKDGQSRIESYECTIDGKWALFEYDLKNNLITHNFDPGRWTYNRKHQLTVKATDLAGNSTTENFTFFK